MSDKQLIIELPEELVAQATAAHIDLRAIVEKALLAELNRQSQWGELPLTLEEKEARLRQLLPPERLEEGLRLLHEGKPIPGLMGGRVWMSEDFDDPLLS